MIKSDRIFINGRVHIRAYRFSSKNSKNTPFQPWKHGFLLPQTRTRKTLHKISRSISLPPQFWLSQIAFLSMGVSTLEPTDFGTLVMTNSACLSCFLFNLFVLYERGAYVACPVTFDMIEIKAGLRVLGCYLNWNGTPAYRISPI